MWVRGGDDVLGAGEEPLHDVSTHVGDANEGLPGGQAHRELGVYEGHAGADEVARDGALEAQIVVGDDARVARLRAGGRDGEDHGEGQDVANGAWDSGEKTSQMSRSRRVPLAMA